MWLRSEVNNIYFPKEDGSFELKVEEVRESRFFVEGPADLNLSLSGSSRVIVRREESGYVNAQCCAGSSFPTAEKRLRRIGDARAIHHCEGSHTDSPSLDQETFEAMRKIKEDVGVLLEDFATLREDFVSVKEDLRGIVLAMSSTL